MLDFLTFALCVPYSETTDGKHFDVLLDMVSERGRMLFRLFQVREQFERCFSFIFDNTEVTKTYMLAYINMVGK